MFEEGLNLLPCPHCGKPATLWAVDMSEGVYVFCDNCGMRGPLTEEMTEHAAITAWNALPRHLRWTKEKPTMPGFYWWRNKEVDPTMATVAFVNADAREGVIVGSDAVSSIDSVDGEWAGPIPEPEEETA